VAVNPTYLLKECSVSRDILSNGHPNKPPQARCRNDPRAPIPILMRYVLPPTLPVSGPRGNRARRREAARLAQRQGAARRSGKTRPAVAAPHSAQLLPYECWSFWQTQLCSLNNKLQNYNKSSALITVLRGVTRLQDCKTAGFDYKLKSFDFKLTGFDYKLPSFDHSLTSMTVCTNHTPIAKERISRRHQQG
jgi:hypothetical protein